MRKIEMCTECIPEAHLRTPKTMPDRHFIIWRAFRAHFWKMCLKHSPDSEFSIPPFLCQERMCLWYTSGACFVISHDFHKIQLIRKLAWNPHQNHISCLHTRQWKCPTVRPNALFSCGFWSIQASLNYNEEALGYNEDVRRCSQMLCFPTVSKAFKPP